MKTDDSSESISLRDIYLRASEKKTLQEREAFLEGACGDDLSLRSKVDALLQENADDSFLENPAGEFQETELETISEGPGTVIGRYKLLQKVGEGGMGVVYMAEQTEPVIRKLALKIIKLGMDTKQVVARFEAERQALAMMDHPNIAKVLDAGATDTGRPYFVMELVRGVPITEYCDKNKLSTERRLDLFMQVCQAIQHAHQKGIIHRDIKPSNVMVTLHDGDPVPKVIDFGIAKATNQKLTEKTLFTDYAQMIGTPTYMSPEQAEMSGLDVDTRTDVYSLGVLFYELLTGTTPFPSKELLSVGYGEMQKIIAEKEPPKPSTRVGTMLNEERTVVATNRRMEESALGKVFKGDLDWIVMKALEKDRTLRYETVNGFVADIKRHLSNEPVTAGAPTFFYQFQKLYRRHRSTIQVAALVAVMLVAASAVATIQAIRATVASRTAERERADAMEARQSAEEERNKTTDALERATRETVRGDVIARFMIQMLERSVPELLRRGRTSSARKLMAQAETLASEGLTQAPAAEFQLRTILAEYYHWSLNDFSKGYEQGERMSHLLGALDDEDLEMPRAEALAVIASARLWNALVTGEREQEAINEITQVADLAASAPDTSGHAGSHCLVSLAMWWSYRGDLASVDEALTSAMRQYANESPSWTGNLIRQTFYQIRSYGFKLPSAEPLLPEMPPLPSNPQPLFVDTFNDALFERCRFAQLKVKFDDALDFLTVTERKIRDAGWAHQDTIQLNLLKAWALLRSGNDHAAYATVVAVGSDPEANVRVWAAATTLAGSFPDQTVYIQLRRDGIARFASEVGGEDAFHFCSAVLLRPLSEDLIEIVRRVLDRVERSPESRSHWIALFGPTIRGALALRTGDYESAIRKLDDYEQMKFDSNFGPAAGGVRDIAWGWRMTRAFALAEAGRNEAALFAFREAMEIREKYSRVSMDIYGFDDVWMHEAEQVLNQKGILDP